MYFSFYPRPTVFATYKKKIKNNNKLKCDE